jgi:phenylacetate-CoA ligase
LVADNFNRRDLRRKRTGGSTSVPLHVFVDNQAFSRKTAATWRHNRWTGYDIGERLAMVWGATPPPATLRGKIRRALYDRSFALDTLAMTEKNMRNFLDRCRRLKPGYMIGHAHSMFLLADFCLSAGIDDIQFTSVITTAMVLLPREREVIERAFQTSVFNRYGCEELSIIASECEIHRGLHLHAEGLITEVVHGDSPVQPGEFGDLVFTDLENHAMPFIRYRIGDVGALTTAPCPCGRTLPLLAEVRGRTADFLHTPEGNRVFGISVLDTMMIHIPGIKQAQLVQEQPDELIVRLVVDRESFAANGDAQLRKELPNYFGPHMRYRFEFVDRILPEKNGKYRFAICNLTEDRKIGLTRTMAPTSGKGDEHR